MPVASVRIEINRSGIKDLLKDAETQRMLDDKAAKVEQAAQSRAPLVSGESGQIPLPVAARSAPESSRARVIVSADHPAGIAVEAKYRLLVSSLDAAR